MRVEQAIFTSVRTGRNEGYQVAASSAGISHAESRELARWGPGHDSLYNESAGSESVNCHRMQSGVYCVSRTVVAGREYSGRGGPRIYTHMFLLPEQLLRRFGDNPFRVVEALLVSGRCTVYEEVPTCLEPIELVGRASSVNVANLEQVVEGIGAHKLASLVRAALDSQRLGVSTSISAKRVFSALFDLLPLPMRAGFSVTTGLRISTTRDYRLTLLPTHAEEHRRAIRQVRLDVLDLTDDVPAKFAPNSGWPLLIHQLLRSQEFATVAKVIDATIDSTESDADVLAEQLREQLEKDADQTVFKTLPA